MKRFRLLFIVPALTLMAILAACGNTTTGGNDVYNTTTTPPSTPTSAATTTGAVIHTTSETVSGNTVTALTNDKGWTLYYFAPDTATTSACATAPCTTNWPPLISQGTPTSKTDLPGTLGLQTNGNGSQVTYNGHDLYTYSGDTGPGQSNGEGAASGKWHVATTDLTWLGGGSTPTPTTKSNYPSY